MRKIVIVRVHRGEKYYVAEGVDLPIVTQAEGLDKLVKNVREAITLYMEGENLKKLDIPPSFSILINFEYRK